MHIIWSSAAWHDYVYWQTTNKQLLRKINALIKDIKESPFEGIGKPEPLKYQLSGYYSRQISEEHRLVYKITNEGIFVLQCRYHYK